MAATITDMQFQTGDGVTSRSFTITPSGVNRVIYLFPFWFGSGINISTIDTGGNTPSLLDYNEHSTEDRIRSAIYRFSNPAATGQTAQVTWSGSVSGGGLVGVAVQDADISGTPESNTVVIVDGDNTTATQTISSAAGELVLDFCYAFCTALTFGAGQSVLTGSGGNMPRNDISGSNFSATATQEAGAASVIMSQTLNATGRWQTGAVAVKAAAAAGSILRQMMMQH